MFVFVHVCSCLVLLICACAQAHTQDIAQLDRGHDAVQEEEHARTAPSTQQAEHADVPTGGGREMHADGGVTMVPGARSMRREEALEFFRRGAEKGYFEQLARMLDAKSEVSFPVCFMPDQ